MTNLINMLYVQWIGLGMLLCFLLIGTVFLLSKLYSKIIKFWFMKKQIKLAMDILKSIPIKADNEIDENENRINLIKKLQENKLNNPLLILKADKLNKEEKNGNIQQGTTTTTAATTDNTRPVDNAVKRFRKVKFGTSTFAGKDSNSNREPNRNDENNHN